MSGGTSVPTDRVSSHNSSVTRGSLGPRVSVFIRGSRRTVQRGKFVPTLVVSS